MSMSDVSAEVTDSSHGIVSWSDRWLGCLGDGDKAFQRRWISLTDDMLLVLYDRLDEREPITSFSLRDINLGCDEPRHVIEVECGDDGCLFRCGEAIEFAATWAALQRVTSIAKSRCPLCAQLQKELDAIARERDAAAASSLGIAQLESQLAVALQDADAKDHEVRMLQEKLQASETQRIEMDKRRSVAESRAAAAEQAERESKARTRESELAAARDVQRATDDSQRRIADADNRVATYAAECVMVRQKMDSLSAELHDARGRIAALERDLESVNDKWRHASQQRDAEAAARRRAEDCLSQRDETVAHLERKQSESTLVAQQADHDLLHLRRLLADHVTELEASRAHCSDLHRKNTTLELANDESNRTLDDLRIKHRTLTEKRAVEGEAADAAARKSLTALEGKTLDLERAHAALHSTRMASLDAERAAAAREADLRALLEHSSEQLQRLSVESKREYEELKRAWAADVAEVRSLADEAIARRNIVVIDSEANTLPFIDAVRCAAEVRAELEEQIARRVHIERNALIARLADTCAQLSDAALLEAEPLVAALQRYVAVSEADDKSVNSDVALVCLSPTTSAVGADGASPRRSIGPKPSVAFSQAAASATAADGTVAWSQVAKQVVDGLARKMQQVLSSAEDVTSPINRAAVVAQEAGFLDAVLNLDAATDMISSNPQARDSVLAHLRGDGSAARALASSIMSAGRGQRTAVVERLCQKVDATFCALFDKCVKSGALRNTDAAWLRLLSRTTGQCTLRAQQVTSADPSTITDSLLDEWCKEAARVGETTRALLQNESAKTHSAEVRDAVNASCGFQLAVFLAMRRFNRSWLRHHQCAESIARFGLALKRAGQLLEKAQIRGSERYSQECLAGWPIVKHLTELPRRLLDEDRAFHVLWDIVAEQIKSAH